MSFVVIRTMKKVLIGALAVAMAVQSAFVIPDAVFGVEEAPTDETNYVENQLIVTFKDNVNNKEAANIVAFAVSEELIRENRGNVPSIAELKALNTLRKIKIEKNVMLVKLGVSLDEMTVAEEIEKNPDVETAQPNYCYEAITGSKTAAGTDQRKTEQWYLDYIDAPEAWKLIEQNKKKSGKAGGKTVTVAYLDGRGVMKAADKQSYEMSVIDTVTGGNKGIVKPIAVDVSGGESNRTQQSVTTTADIIAGMDYACNHNARIITMCFGRRGYDAALERKVNWAAKEGVLIIAPAGDGGSTDAWYPSDYDSCLSCINTNQYKDAYSTACRNETSNYGDKKDISAPGTSINAADEKNNAISGTGTSYAAAVVTAAAAMVMYTDPKLPASKVKDLLVDTANDISVTGYDVYTGYGNVNAYKAVAKAAGVKVSDHGGTLGKTKAKARGGAGNITISWTKVKGAEHYIVSRKGSGDKDYSQITDLSKEETSWTDEGCEADEEYSYKIVAVATAKDGKKIKGESSEPVSAKIIQ